MEPPLHGELEQSQAHLQDPSSSTFLHDREQVVHDREHIMLDMQLQECGDTSFDRL